MAQHDGSTMIERAAEIRELASVIFADSFGMDWTTALHEADRQLDQLLAFAADWDAQAEPEPPAPEPLYVPSVLTPAEVRATDKAMFERAGGVRPRIVGRFAFVPSRTTGGTVYRTSLDGSSCTCEAGQRGLPCWHSRLVLLERELAA